VILIPLRSGSLEPARCRAAVWRALGRVWLVQVRKSGMTSMAAKWAPERITGTSKLLEEKGERYEHWKGGREQVDVA
jgi:hypothetical protein